MIFSGFIFFFFNGIYIEMDLGCVSIESLILIDNDFILKIMYSEFWNNIIDGLKRM